MRLFQRRPTFDELETSDSAPAGVPATRRPAPSAGELRRERKALLGARDERIYDLGGVVLEMYRQDAFRESLLLELCAEVAAMEDRLRELDLLLDALDGLRPHAVRAAPRSSGDALLRPVRAAGGRDPERLSVATPTPQVLEAGDCPRCGTAYAQYQEYCIACGQRLAAVPGVGDALAAASGRRSSWSPGDWLWRAVALFVVALLAAAAVLAQRAARDDDPETLVIATTVIGRETLVASAGAPTAEPSLALPEAAAGPVQAAVPPPPKATSRRRVAWPAGVNGFTVVLASVPERNRPGATGKAREASDAGVKDVGVLDSSEFSSLHPGYLVVFSGVFETRAAAEAAIATARASGYNDAYAAEVAR